jgi:cystathionine beta-lyase/cystathionine gamma-synthase
VVTFELDGGFAQCDRFADALRYFAISASLGSVESLVLPSRLLGNAEFTREQRESSLINQGTVRLSIGLEDADDLIEDVGQALEKAG